MRPDLITDSTRPISWLLSGMQVLAQICKSCNSMATYSMAVPDKYLSMVLAEAREINARVAERRAELEARARQLEIELDQIRAVLSAMPTPSLEPVESYVVDGEMQHVHVSPDQVTSTSQRVIAVLLGASVPLTSSEIMEQLISMRIVVSPGVLHTTISRLHERGEIRALGERGERRYVCSEHVSASTLRRFAASKLVGAKRDK